MPAMQLKGSNWPAAAAAAAGALLGAGVVVRRNAMKAERELPAIGRFLEIRGARLHYLEQGEGEPVVFLHGNGSLLQDFLLSGVFDLVSGARRAIAFDRPGYGYSSRPGRFRWTPREQAALLLEACRALGARRPLLVAHSWGTLVALEAALHFPHELRGLVLLSGYYYPTVRPDAAVLSTPAVPVVGDVLRYSVSPLLGQAVAPALMSKLFAPQAVPPRFRREFPLRLTLRPWQLRASAEESAMMVPAAAALRGRYKQLRVPLVVMAGAGDRIVDPQAQSARLSHDVPAQLRVVAGAGHMVHHAAPELVRDAMRDCAS